MTEVLYAKAKDGTHLAYRVLDASSSPEIGRDVVMVTESVVAAVVGQAMAFVPLGTHDLKGVPGTWHLFRLVLDP